MGNNASSPKAAGPDSGARAHHRHSSQQQPQPQPQPNSQSPHAPKSRNPPLVPTSRVVPVPPEHSKTHAQGSTVSATPPRSMATPVSSRPVAVPGSGAASSSANTASASPAPLDDMTLDTAAQQVPGPESEPPLSPYYADSIDVPLLGHNSMQEISYLTRPPRLPLPIEEEVHTPGSPIMGPRRDGEPVEYMEPLDGGSAGGSGGGGGGGDADGDGDSRLTHRSSTLSSTTVDEEDMEELRVDKTRPTVPTRLEWLRGGDKVYVTGTIFQWNKKQRMHPVEGRPGVFATTVNVLPGTHHVRFLVDGHMETSRDLPTTVDFGNNLVNYIEVEPENSPPASGPAVPLPVPTSGGPSSSSTGGPASGAKAPGISVLAQQHQQQLEAQRQLEQQRLAKEKQQQQQQQQQEAEPNPVVRPLSAMELANKAPRWKSLPGQENFRAVLPKYLMDYDQPDESPEFRTAMAATDLLPPPPSLPSFLAKPILNAATLMKDDNSVLNMPNYTILNHLATSSIKNNILAVSATTRYKDKFVTIIIYKPTGGEDKHPDK